MEKATSQSWMQVKGIILPLSNTKGTKYQNSIGQRKYLTPSDILMINTAYGCPDKF